ncbi:MAG: hypothetical protein H7039_22280 [Bryobacteraceae bacterium]|nr:hypothetical protein [Bryobacteraceae bacterium]
MRRSNLNFLLCLAAFSTLSTVAQIIEFESNGLKYQALTRDGLTIMVAGLPAHVRDYAVIQVAVSNGAKKIYTVRPEDFLFLREDGAEIIPVPPREVVNSLSERASRSDVVKLVTSYENSIYGNTQYKGTNGYEQRRQSAMTDFTSTRLRAAAAASAIAFVNTKLPPGQSTDGAIFYPASGKSPLGGTIRVRTVGGLVYEFPLVNAAKTSAASAQSATP